MKHSGGKPFTPNNPEKYVGEYPILYRSSWELEFMKYCDQHPDIIEWASEPWQIPYKDPLTGKQKIYIPDFLITQINKSKEISKKLIEIKPMHEELSEHARNAHDAMIQARNRAKWGAALSWAARRGIQFLVMNESHMFAGHENRKPRAHPVREYAPGQSKDNRPKAKKTSKKSTILSKLRKKAKSSKKRTGKVRSI